MVNVKPGNYVIKGDHTKLMQVMLNVMKNSLEAIDMERENKWITVSIGIGQRAYRANNLPIMARDLIRRTSEQFFERGFTTKKKRYRAWLIQLQINS